LDKGGVQPHAGMTGFRTAMHTNAMSQIHLNAKV
jgi:hypothetical protein